MTILQHGIQSLEDRRIRREGKRIRNGLRRHREERTRKSTGYPKCGQRKTGRLMSITEFETLHEQRIRELTERVQRELRREPRDTSRQGRQRRVRCVQTGMEFESITAAGHFVSRASSNVLRSIRGGIKCGGMNWEYVD
jgi:hypothetical protein